MICPRCGGAQRLEDGRGPWCDYCGGTGHVDGPAGSHRTPRGGGGVGGLAAVALLMTVVALPVVAIGIVSSWWLPAVGVLRDVLEAVTPDGAVAREWTGEGRPWVVAGVVAGLTVLVVMILSVARRRAVRRVLLDGSPLRVAHGWGLARAVTLLAGLSLARAAGFVASGMDLRPGTAQPPLQWWQLLLVVVVVGAYAYLGTGRRVARQARRLGLP